MRLFESLLEFTADGGKYQLSRAAEGTWTRCWQSTILIGRAKCIRIEAGVTSTVPSAHTACINVTVSPVSLANGAEDQADEQITVFYEDFQRAEDAVDRLKKFALDNQILVEDEMGQTQPLSLQLWTQTAAPTLITTR
jgi:hypothetical protein